MKWLFLAVVLGLIFDVVAIVRRAHTIRELHGKNK